MVRIDRIYTRTGDAGQTSTGDGRRVSKLDPAIVAGGSVDELNSVIGLAVAQNPESALSGLLQALQQLLFDAGADLCCAWNQDPEHATSGQHDRCPRISAGHVEHLELLIDQYVAGLQPLTSFILPGGTPQAAFLHLARSVCRRAEIDVLRLAEVTPVNPQLSICLNRFSDLLFVLARAANDHGKSDVLWKPGNSFPIPANPVVQFG
jgi:cob(I)alamin adenosyltransferase